MVQVDNYTPNLELVGIVLSEHQKKIEELDEENLKSALAVHDFASSILNEAFKNTCFSWYSDDDEEIVYWTKVKSVSVDEINVSVDGESIMFENGIPIKIIEDHLSYFDPDTFHEDITPVTLHEYEEYCNQIKR